LSKYHAHRENENEQYDCYSFHLQSSFKMNIKPCRCGEAEKFALSIIELSPMIL